MQVFKIQEPVFKVEPLFVINASWPELLSSLKKHGLILEADDSPNVAGMMMTFDCAPWRVVWVRKYELPTLIHEIFHLVSRICCDRQVGIVAKHPDGSIGDETAAYLMEYFTTEALKKLKKKKNA